MQHFTVGDLKPNSLNQAKHAVGKLIFSLTSVVVLAGFTLYIYNNEQQTTEMQCQQTDVGFERTTASTAFSVYSTEA